MYMATDLTLNSTTGIQTEARALSILNPDLEVDALLDKPSAVTDTRRSEGSPTSAWTSLTSEISYWIVFSTLMETCVVVGSSSRSDYIVWVDRAP